MENDKPITDKENFPPPVPGPGMIRTDVFVGSMEAAYHDGYKAALRDFVLYTMAFFIVFSMVRKMYATN